MNLLQWKFKHPNKKKIREEKEEISIYICCQQKGSLSKLRENREFLGLN